MIIIVAPFLKSLHTLAFTFFPFIFVRDESIKNNKYTINHEKIHIKQQVEMIVTGGLICVTAHILLHLNIIWYLLFSFSFFYLWYYIEYLIRAIYLKSFSEAYYRISFEMEAYANETNLEYLKIRIVWAFLKYVT